MEHYCTDDRVGHVDAWTHGVRLSLFLQYLYTVNNKRNRVFFMEWKSAINWRVFLDVFLPTVHIQFGQEISVTLKPAEGDQVALLRLVCSIWSRQELISSSLKGSTRCRLSSSMNQPRWSANVTSEPSWTALTSSVLKKHLSSVHFTTSLTWLLLTRLLKWMKLLPKAPPGGQSWHQN